MAAKIGAPRRLNDPLDGAAAIDAGLSGAVINLQPLLVKIRRAGREPKIKQSVRSAAVKIQRHRAPAINRPGQHVPDCAAQFFRLRQSQLVRRKFWRNFSAKKGLARINVAHARHERLIQQSDFDGLPRAFQSPGQKSPVENHRPKVPAPVFPSPTNPKSSVQNTACLRKRNVPGPNPISPPHVSEASHFCRTETSGPSCRDDRAASPVCPEVRERSSNRRYFPRRDKPRNFAPVKIF